MPFQAVWDELKPYEVRKADRDFQVGDELLLREWSQDSGYSGRRILAKVTYMTPPGHWGIPQDVCILGIRVILRMP